MRRDAADFLAAAGWAEARRMPLAGDASKRRYERLERPDGKRAVLMDAPPDSGEDVGRFSRIARFLGGIGLSAPEVLCEDLTAGYLLLEDLGDRLFAREMAADPACEAPLYAAAAATLGTLHRAAPPPGLDVFAAETVVPQTALAYDWYLPGITGSENGAARTRFCDLLHPILARLDGELDVVILRDYHAENLLWLPEREGVARVGLLDFQDALRGHRAYDLVSVLQDARRDLGSGMEARTIEGFVRDNGLDPQEFACAYAILGLQRNLRILGIFARLCLRDGKGQYVDLIPRVWRHVTANLAHPLLQELGEVILRDLPEPTPQALARLREARGRWAGR